MKIEAVDGMPSNLSRRVSEYDDLYKELDKLETGHVILVKLSSKLEATRVRTSAGNYSRKRGGGYDVTTAIKQSDDTDEWHLYIKRIS